MQVSLQQVYNSERAEDMALGELKGSKVLYAASPLNVTRPVAAGCLSTYPIDEMPGTTDFAAVVAKLHNTTHAPNGKFGFHSTSFSGNPPVNTSWCDSWGKVLYKNDKSRLLKRNEPCMGVTMIWTG
ncbi:hypothetical protein GGS21DRAFT_523366 [Xylaria nigripes]|nr:hypothetical protein GGS21DRAFT_523366 [Xylaria nigripes]